MTNEEIIVEKTAEQLKIELIERFSVQGCLGERLINDLVNKARAESFKSGRLSVLIEMKDLATVGK